jgi:hypothetical protein
MDDAVAALRRGAVVPARVGVDRVAVVALSSASTSPLPHSGGDGNAQSRISLDAKRWSSKRQSFRSNVVKRPPVLSTQSSVHPSLLTFVVLQIDGTPPSRSM